MPKFSAKRLLVAVEASLQDCSRQLRECERAWRDSDFVNAPAEELLSGEQAQLAYFLRKAHLNLVMLLEAAEAPLLLQEYLSGFDRFRDDLETVGHVDQDPDIMFSEALIYLTHFVDVAAPQIAAEHGERAVGRAQLIRILRETPFFLRKFNIVPLSEKMVCDPMHTLLKTVYPDTTREFTIPQPNKTYHVDMGVKSLRIGIEFKFATTEQELKTCLDGILTDMKGYHGSRDWDEFLAVFYTAGPVESEARIETMFRVMNGDFRWRPIVVVGDGGRKMRVKQQPAAAAGPTSKPLKLVNKSAKSVSARSKATKI